jgi:spore germination protein YaaH
VRGAVIAVLWATVPAIAVLGMAGRPDVWGFHAPWDPRSAASVAAHADQLAVVVSGWIALDSTSGAPAMRYPDTLRLRGHARRFALVTTYARDRFHPELIRQLGSDAAARERVAGAIATLAVAGDYRGLILDFEGQTPADTAALAAVVRAVADSAHRHRIAPVTVAVPPAESIAYAPRVLRAADLLLVMLYDQHWATSPPGPIASPEWVASLLGTWVERAGASRIVAGLPAYGYAWAPGANASVVSFGDVAALARRTGLPLVRDTIAQMLHVTRADSVDIWVSDAPLLATLVAEVERTGVRHIALWRLGLEDPAIWQAAIR